MLCQLPWELLIEALPLPFKGPCHSCAVENVKYEGGSICFLPLDDYTSTIVEVQGKEAP